MIYVNRSRRGLFIGLFIVMIGLVLLLDQENILSAARVFHFFWPAVFIFFGVEFIVSCKGGGGRGLVGWLMLAFGLVLLVGALGYLNVGFYTLWPLLLIIWGVWIVSRTFGGDRALTAKIEDAIHHSVSGQIKDDVNQKVHDAVYPNNIPGGAKKSSPRDWGESVRSAIQDTMNSWTGRESTDPEFDYMAIFGAIKQRVTVKNFRGGRLTAIFGGFEVDLTRADIEGQTAVIDASALMGGGEIRVPYSWIVEIRGVALLGGYTDETHQEVSDTATAKRLIVKGIAALGGVVIKN
jgi:Cell wall-active antibiotics response 4TMS YvqF/Domain of unknown function (DUF5668)